MNDSGDCVSASKLLLIRPQVFINEIKYCSNKLQVYVVLSYEKRDYHSSKSCYLYVIVTCKHCNTRPVQGYNRPEWITNRNYKPFLPAFVPIQASFHYVSSVVKNK